MTIYVPAHAPWAYRPNEYDDWGTVRDRDGLVVVRASLGAYTTDELDAHRRAKTDPTEKTCLALIRAFNNHDELVTALRNLLKQVAWDGTEADAARAALSKAEGR